MRNVCFPILHATRAVGQLSLGRFVGISRSSTPFLNFLKVARTSSLVKPEITLILPRSCPGCGAFTQTISPGQAGFYTTTRKAVQAFIAWSRNTQIGSDENIGGTSVGLPHQYFAGLLDGDQGLVLYGAYLTPLAGNTCC
jgi:hypothetical protein